MHDYNGVDQWHVVQKILDDNNRPSAANLALSGAEVDMDRFLYLKNRGPAKALVVSSGQVTVSGSTLTGPSGLNATWQDFATANGLTPFAQLNSCKVGDVVEVRFESGFAVATQDSADVQLLAVQNSGVSPVAAAVAGAIAHVVANTADTTDVTNTVLPQMISIGGFVTITVAGALLVKLQGRNTNSGGQVGILGDAGSLGQYYSLRLIRHRPF